MLPSNHYAQIADFFTWVPDPFRVIRQLKKSDITKLNDEEGIRLKMKRIL